MYDIQEYHNDLTALGIKETWNKILSKFKNETDCYGGFNIENFGYYYEEGLAYLDKERKKGDGKYYTPQDVATLMSEYFSSLKGENICDICCGVGNLILAYLKYIGKEKAVELLKDKKVWLYDIDETAMMICIKTIEILYGIVVSPDRYFVCDFLNKDIGLPKDSKVICNPPYYNVQTVPQDWKNSYVLLSTKEIYAVIMEKILSQSVASVLITPWSFISMQKFYPLRVEMNKYNGFIFSFDNMPSCIFNGKKQGQFNTNSNNSIRAAITVVENKENVSGFKVSGLIRFKAEERHQMLKKEYLQTVAGNTYQIVDDYNQRYAKCFPQLEKIKNLWFLKSNKKLKDYVAKNGEVLYTPNTCRYFTVATKRDLKRTGKLSLCINKEQTMYIYCLLNSSFCYWYWRLYDGGIQYPLNLLYELPCFYDLLTEDDKKEIERIYKEMTEREQDFLVYKKNAGALQESVKFPKEYRERINNIFLKALGCDADSSIFIPIHSNSIYNKEEESDD